MKRHFSLTLPHCDSKISFFTAKFVGNSYIKYIDPLYEKRDLQYSRISLNFTTNQIEGLMVWLGKAEDEDNDFLAIGLANGALKVVINLGERISVPMIHSKDFTCSDERWHFVTVIQNQTKTSLCTLRQKNSLLFLSTRGLPRLTINNVSAGIWDSWQSAYK
uniref:Laminin G domain-containing protein n=1 Tax=Meleagris gallopavo TaxID=9103 RepID=A0A803Y0T2_MELGA